MRRTYKRDGWTIRVGEYAKDAGPRVWVELASPMGRRAEYEDLYLREGGEVCFDEPPYPEFTAGTLQESEHIRELTSWAVAQWYAAEKALEPYLAV